MLYHKRMKKIIVFVQKSWKETFIVIGVYLLVSGLVGFNASVGCRTGGRINPYNRVTGCEGTVAYGYTEQGERQIAFGSSLIAIGILAKMRRKS